MKKLLIAGGGIAGFSLIKELQKKRIDLEIVLVEPREYLEVPFAQLRALMDPEVFGKNIRRRYKELLPGIRHIQDRLVSVGSEHIVLESGNSETFDYLVLATGSSFSQWSYLNGGEQSTQEREETVRTEGKKIEEASSILIIGGGPIGVELAGEIAHSYPEKKVMIAQGPDRLLGPSHSSKMSRRAERVLSDMDVEIYNNSYFKKDVDGSWQNDKGDRVTADLVIPAVGIDINSQWAAGSEGIRISERGAVAVDSDLRIRGRSNVFALGDINDVPEIKLGVNAGAQAKGTAGNILRLLSDKKQKLSPYKPAADIGLITLGPHKSAVQLPFGHPHFLGALKQKDFFAGRYLGSKR